MRTKRHKSRKLNEKLDYSFAYIKSAATTRSGTPPWRFLIGWVGAHYCNFPITELHMSRFTCLLTLVAIMTPTLQAAESQTTHDGWTFTSARPEIAPQSSVHQEGGGYGLVIKGNGDAIADGRWVKLITLPAGEYVSFSARYRATNIEMAARNVIAGLVWLDEKGKEVGNSEHAATSLPADADGWRQIRGIYQVPPKAKQAQIELRLRWSPQGEVEFRDAQLAGGKAPTRAR
jgi:hypothetical protein